MRNGQSFDPATAAVVVLCHWRHGELGQLVGAAAVAGRRPRPRSRRRRRPRGRPQTVGGVLGGVQRPPEEGGAVAAAAVRRQLVLVGVDVRLGEAEGAVEDAAADAAGGEGRRAAVVAVVVRMLLILFVKLGLN